MASFLKLLLVYLTLFCIFKAGSADCSLADITVDQRETGLKVSGKTEYEVVVSNDCTCTQSNVQLDCTGFNTAEPVNQMNLKLISRDRCVVNNRRPIIRGSLVIFRYASNTKFGFAPVSSEIKC